MRLADSSGVTLPAPIPGRKRLASLGAGRAGVGGGSEREPYPLDERPKPHVPPDLFERPSVLRLCCCGRSDGGCRICGVGSR